MKGKELLKLEYNFYKPDKSSFRGGEWDGSSYVSGEILNLYLIPETGHVVGMEFDLWIYITEDFMNGFQKIISSGEFGNPPFKKEDFEKKKFSEEVTRMYTEDVLISNEDHPVDLEKISFVNSKDVDSTNVVSIIEKPGSPKRDLSIRGINDFQYTILLLDLGILK